MAFFGGNSEKSIARRLHHGDSGAMRDFYALYANHLAGVCSRYIANDEDKKDVFQDCLLTIIQHIDSFEYRGEGSLKAWATRVTINQSIAFLKKRNGMATVELDGCNAEQADDEPPDISDISADTLHAMIRQLPDGYRTVFNLYVVENKSHHEIAQMLGIKEVTSASQLHRAKAMLAQKINEYRKDRHIRP